jgi:hypothetical protein
MRSSNRRPLNWPGKLSGAAAMAPGLQLKCLIREAPGAANIPEMALVVTGHNSIWGFAIISQNMVATAAKAGTPNAHHCQKIR